MLIQSLMRRELVDEFVLLIHPLILGTGRRLFADETAAANLRVVLTTDPRHTAWMTAAGSLTLPGRGG